MQRSLPWIRMLAALCVGGTLCACPAEKDAADASGAHEDAGDDPDGTDAGRTDAGRTDAGKPDSGQPDGGQHADGGGDAAKGDAAGAESAPELESATAHQSGRFGADLRIDVTGTDLDGDAVALRVTVYLASGRPATIGDADGDGKGDPGEVQLPLTMALPAKADATGYLVLPGLYLSSPQFDHADVALVDATGLASDTLTVSVDEQPVLNADEECDATYVESRCVDGYACKGSAPSVCMPGEAPTVTRAAYLADELGTRILIEGTDPDLDVTRYALDFLDGTGASVMIDTDLDGSPDASSFEGAAKASWDGSKFFVRIEPGGTFADSVAKVQVTIKDRGGLSSQPVVATKAVAPVRTAGQACDVRTFDRCAASAVCISTNGGKNYSCTAITAARTKACASGLLLEPAKGVNSVRGSIADPSLWDAPTGCVAGTDPTGQPEAMVKLVLASAVSKVTLSTNNVYTSFDSALYVMSKCDATPVLAWCEDYALDKQSSGAELVLNDLAAGTYYVVVDSFNSSLSGTTFQLDVSVE